MSAEHQFVTKDSGVRAAYESGMVRDTQDGKAQFGLIRPEGVPYSAQFMTRVAELMTRGIGKYGYRNWEKANSQKEIDRFRESAERHLNQYLAGDADEDHAAAVVFNLLAAETTRWKIEREAARETEAILSDPETMAAIEEAQAELSRREEQKPPWPKGSVITVKYEPTGDNDPWNTRHVTEYVDGSQTAGELKAMVVRYFSFGDPRDFELWVTGGSIPLEDADVIADYVGPSDVLKLVIAPARDAGQDVTAVGDHLAYNYPIDSLRILTPDDVAPLARSGRTQL